MRFLVLWFRRLLSDISEAVLDSCQRSGLAKQPGLQSLLRIAFEPTVIYHRKRPNRRYRVVGTRGIPTTPSVNLVVPGGRLPYTDDLLPLSLTSERFCTAHPTPLCEAYGYISLDHLVVSSSPLSVHQTILLLLTTSFYETLMITPRLLSFVIVALVASTGVQSRGALFPLFLRPLFNNNCVQLLTQRTSLT